MRVYFAVTPTRLTGYRCRVLGVRAGRALIELLATRQRILVSRAALRRER